MELHALTLPVHSYALLTHYTLPSQSTVYTGYILTVLDGQTVGNYLMLLNFVSSYISFPKFVNTLCLLVACLNVIKLADK